MALWKKTPKPQRWMLAVGCVCVTFFLVIVASRTVDTVTARNYRVKVTTEKGSFELEPAATTAASRVTER
ncbi:MAG: hypothetical protein KF764_13585 [Labilithrix sp.]|nr:hypothetical protein [Labilithrix sp.]